jgi:hypothetical protein
MFIPLTVWTPVNKPTIPQLIEELLSIPNQRTAKIGAGIKLLAPIFEYRIIFENTAGDFTQEINQKFNIAGVHGVVKKIVGAGSILEFYFLVNLIPEEFSRDFNIDPELLIEIITLGIPNILEYGTIQKIQIDLKTVITIILLIIAVGIAVQ